jgi:CheY-like chemotaxis protein
MLLTDVAGNERVVLLAEDDDNDVVLIRRAVKRLDLADCLIAVSAGEEVIAYLEGRSHFADRQRYPLPSVVVLDQHLPQRSGLEVLLWLRSSPRHEHLPVVILSLLSPAQREAALLMNAAWSPKTTTYADLPDSFERAADLSAKELGVRMVTGTYNFEIKSRRSTQNIVTESYATQTVAQ